MGWVLDQERNAGTSRVHTDAAIGSNVQIGRGVTIAEDAVIGDDVEIADGAFIDLGVTIEAAVSIGPNATLTTRGQSRPGAIPKVEPILIRSGATIGANATITGGLTIGKNAQVGHGAVVRRSVPVNAIVEGNPAIIVGYVQSERRRANDSSEPAPTWKDGVVDGVSVYRMPKVDDLRGTLSVGEFGNSVPFDVKRYFLVFDVPNAEVRGEHAHRECHQFLICLRGSLSIVVDNGTARDEYTLDNPTTGLHIPPMVWGIQYRHTRDAMLLVFASHTYNPDDYIRDYDEFILEKKTSDA
jgi:UDP-2-acetamido-3-amino-2,3-dideoxy-glucuronate N-acetyltransferase